MEKRHVDTDADPWVSVGRVTTCGTSGCFCFSLKLEERASTESRMLGQEL